MTSLLCGVVALVALSACSEDNAIPDTLPPVEGPPSTRFVVVGAVITMNRVDGGASIGGRVSGIALSSLQPPIAASATSATAPTTSDLIGCPPTGAER